MIEEDWVKQAHDNDWISNESFLKINQHQSERKFSLYAEFTIVLYVAVLLITSGISIWIYSHLDSIGHSTILIALALITAIGLFFSFKWAIPFSKEKVQHPKIFYDYLVLGSFMLLSTFLGYLNYQYEWFGSYTGYQFIPAAIACIYGAYRTDHAGVLSLGITNLAAFLGLSTSPKGLLIQNNFSSESVIWSAFALGLILVAAAYITYQINLKKHLVSAYLNIAIHLLFISTIAAMIEFSWGLWFNLVILILAVGWYRYSKYISNFWYFLLLTIYSYIALTYDFIRILSNISNREAEELLILIHFIGTSSFVLWFIKSNYAKFRNNAQV